MPKAKKTHVKSTHKDFAAKNTLNPPSSGDSMPPTRATPPQQQDPKRRIGQHTGAGEPPLMKK